MDIEQGIKLLKEQIAKTDSLAVPPAFNPQYDVWDRTTTRILTAVFDPETVELYTSIYPDRAAMSDEEHFRIFEDVLTRKKQMIEEIIREHERLAETDISLAKSEDTPVKELRTSEKIASKKVFVVHGHDRGTKERIGISNAILSRRFR